MNNYRTFACKTVGYNHIKNGTGCQDAVGKYEDDRVSIVAVSDGHGSPQYFRSDIGAQLAVQVAIDAANAFVDCIDFTDDTAISEEKISFRALEDAQQREDLIVNLQRNILIAWHEAIAAHYQENPFTQEDLADLKEKYRQRYLAGAYESVYGATLIAVIMTEKFWIGLHIGDGHCVVFDQNCAVERPIAWDDDCHFEVVTSLCQDDAKDHFRYFYTQELPFAIFIASDGVDNSYCGEEMVHDFYKGVISIFDDDFEGCVQEIQNYLPTITRKGSGDDVSICGIMNLDDLQGCVQILEKANEKAKAETEEKAEAEENAEAKAEENAEAKAEEKAKAEIKTETDAQQTSTATHSLKEKLWQDKQELIALMAQKDALQLQLKELELQIVAKKKALKNALKLAKQKKIF